MKTILKDNLSCAVVFATLIGVVMSTPQWLTASDGRRYYVEFELNSNWLEALDACARNGLQLVVIDNAAKNGSLVARLKANFASNNFRPLWIGHHDEFSSMVSRPFYSASTGTKINFHYWTSGNPDNRKKSEHCVHTNGADFKWNDMPCHSYKFGYICEEHALTTKYRNDMMGKRTTAYDRNDKVYGEFTSTQNKVQQVNGNTLQYTDNALVDFQTSATEVIEELKKSIYALLLEKPYMQAVIADVGDAITKMSLEAEEKLNDISDYNRQLVRDIHLNADKTINDLNKEFAEKLKTNNNDIDELLVY